MKVLQQITLGVSLLMADVNDWITMAMGQSSGIENMLSAAKTFLARIGPFIKSIIDMVMPAFSIVADVVKLVMDILSALMPVVGRIMKAITPILSAVSEAFSAIIRAVAPLLEVVGLLLEMMVTMAVMTPAFRLLLGSVELLGKAILWFSDKVITPFYDLMLDMVQGMAGLLNSAIGALKDIEILGWQPFEDMDYIDMEGIDSAQQSNAAGYESNTTNNYIYGSNTLDQLSGSGEPTDLFSNSYVLVND